MPVFSCKARRWRKASLLVRDVICSLEGCVGHPGLECRGQDEKHVDEHCEDSNSSLTPPTYVAVQYSVFNSFPVVLSQPEPYCRRDMFTSTHFQATCNNNLIYPAVVRWSDCRSLTFGNSRHCRHSVSRAIGHNALLAISLIALQIDNTMSLP